MKMPKNKKFSISLFTNLQLLGLFFIIASCSHVTIDIPKNELIDTVDYKNQKYLIPIPKSYCRYNPKVKSDQPVLNFLNAEGKKEVISLYEESCEAKEKVISGELRDSPRSIDVDLSEQKDRDIEYYTRKDLIDFFYKNTPLELSKKLIRESAIKVLENLKKNDSSKYGFSRKRSEILIEDYESYINHKDDIRLKKDKDDYAFYLFYSGKADKIISYSVQSSTKIYNKNITVTITRTVEKAGYDRSIANQIMQEAKSYMKEFVNLNDKNDYRTHKVNDKKIKVFTPKDFIFPHKEQKDFTAKFNEVKFLDPKDKNFKEAFIKGDSNEFRRMAIGFPYAADVNLKYLDSKESYIDAAYVAMRSSFQSRSFNVTKERNSVFFMICSDDNICADDSKKTSVIFLASTLLHKTPTLIMGEISSKEGRGPIKKESISEFKEEIMRYIDYLELNQ